MRTKETDPLDTLIGIAKTYCQEKIKGDHPASAFVECKKGYATIPKLEYLPKKFFLPVMTKILKDLEAERVVFVSEAWVCPDIKPGDPRIPLLHSGELEVHDMPEAKDGVFIMATENKIRVSMSTAEITTKNGERVLSEWKDNDDSLNEKPSCQMVITEW